MKQKDEEFEVISEDAIASYIKDYVLEPIVLNEKRVPPSLRHLIPLAEKWGIGDDIIRTHTVAEASPDERKMLSQALDGLEDDFDDWLAGPESSGPDWSDEYNAFSCLRLACDYADGFDGR